MDKLRRAQVLPNSSRQHNPEPKLHSSFWYEHVCSNIQIQTLFQFQSPASKADFQSGDLVVLGAEGYEGSTAVVCEMSAMDCKVAILDPSRSFKKAEHHVKSSDMRLIHEEWRIGTRHIIGGLQSSRMKHLNGLAACVRPWACAFRNVL